MSIIQIPTTNFWQNRSGYTPKWLILHGTAGGRHAKDIAQQFINSQGTSDPKSVHYVVDQDGIIVQCVQEKDAAWGNGVWEPGADSWWSTALNPNLVTISIEHVKSDVNNASALTPAQQAASFALIRDICGRNNIPMRKADKNGGITGHFSISPVDRSHCPGTFPWQDLFNYLKGGDMLQITDAFAAAYFKQVGSNPTRWRCNNGFDVLGGILTFYCHIQGAPRLPLNNEQYGIPGVVWQKFEGGIIVYDPENKLDGFHSPFPPSYLLKLDSDLGKQLLGITDLQTRIQVLQNQQGTSLQPQLDAANAALATERQTNANLAAQVADLNKQIADLKSQLANSPNKATILADLVNALETAAKNIQ